MKVSRRGVIAGAGVLAAGAAGGWALVPEDAHAGTLGGADLARGHRLRGGGFPEPSVTDEVGVVIAGGGIAGLSAGWTLAEAGYEDFRLLELEDRVGGNARGGRNAVSAHPLGAHYLPIPNREARALRHMLGRLGIVVGEAEGRPVYDPLQLCADLQERLLWQGRWHEGLVPATGLSAAERAEWAGFDRVMAGFSARVGSDGRPAFATPIAYSSRDAELLALDAAPFGDWLDEQGFRSRPLRGHVRYAMRDDYGCEPEAVSAWAGIHYWAGRRGWAAQVEGEVGGAGENVLTWPEGNARLAGAMAARFRERIVPGRIVHRVARDGDGMVVDSFDVAAGRTVRTRAKAVVAAMGQFVAKHVVEGVAGGGFSHAPWVVANVTVDRPPGGRGAPLAWDNVSATSESLGYVVATHQGPDARTAGTVLTWYMPLSRDDPAEARRKLLSRPVAEWQAEVARDLLLMHPELEGAIRLIDVWRWAHAMARPTPGFVWGRARAVAASVAPPLFLAHSDFAGLPLFEEAHDAGTRAAEGAMRHLGHAFESLV